MFCVIYHCQTRLGELLPVVVRREARVRRPPHLRVQRRLSEIVWLLYVSHSLTLSLSLCMCILYVCIYIYIYIYSLSLSVSLSLSLSLYIHMFIYTRNIQRVQRRLGEIVLVISMIQSGTLFAIYVVCHCFCFTYYSLTIFLLVVFRSSFWQSAPSGAALTPARNIGIQIDMCIYIYIYIHIYMCVYIYIYVYIVHVVYDCSLFILWLSAALTPASGSAAFSATGGAYIYMYIIICIRMFMYMYIYIYIYI